MYMKDEIFDTPIADIRLQDNIVSCDINCNLQDAIKLLKNRNIGSIVIMDQKSPVGIFTERDYINKISTEESKHLDSPISQFMTPNPVCIKLDNPIRNAFALMNLGKIRHLLVKDKDDHLINVLSVRDLIEFVVDQYSN